MWSNKAPEVKGHYYYLTDRFENIGWFNGNQVEGSWSVATLGDTWKIGPKLPSAAEYHNLLEFRRKCLYMVEKGWDNYLAFWRDEPHCAFQRDLGTETYVSIDTDQIEKVWDELEYDKFRVLHTLPLYCGRRLGIRPMHLHYPKDPKTIELFDACGPERPADRWNPLTWPSECASNVTHSVPHTDANPADVSK